MSEQRASDADRDQAAEHLRRAGGDGRLSVDELGERVQRAYQARSRSELDCLLDDIDGSMGTATQRAGSSGIVIQPGDGGARWIISIMSGATRKGHWRVGRQLTVVNLMGGSEIDLAAFFAKEGGTR